MVLDKIILKSPEFFAKSLDIKITSSDIIEKINAFDWLELGEATSQEEYSKIIYKVYSRFNFKYKKSYEQIVILAFANLFTEAVLKIKEAIESVHRSYNVEGSGNGFRNAIVDRYYYIQYWADKKNIPVNYNEKDEAKRNLFNFDTIVLSILADKLAIFNNYEANKPKK